ncbi:hypothetical protein J5277_28805 [Rhizobium sp. 16-449-1b]|uniref:hypothetical protein n=1 Tax=Rhizobium sp. 16-449-1b TaxID=2819989 RepID=UPI001ADBB0A7|nr:hypothetical protein [Rhizobium sp. 16-449-1b]MBO9198133.1 hypothetical protein [Rhizobium sp. 16-449-1b]
MSVIASQKVARRIARRRAGLSFLDRRLPRDERIVGMQDRALRRTVRVPAPHHVGSHRSYEPTHGLATRFPPVKNASTARGWTIFKNVIVSHESELEHRVSMRTQARNDVVALHSQYPVFDYNGPDGKDHTHTADFYVEYDNEWTEALVVKHEKEREENEDIIERILQNPSSQSVDRIVLLTETYGNIEALENASMVMWSREYHHQPDVDEVLEIVRRQSGWMRFGTLLMNTPYVARRRAAIWRLIDTGVLFSSTGEKITELSWLGYDPAGSATGLRG